MLKRIGQALCVATFAFAAMAGNALADDKPTVVFMLLHADAYMLGVEHGFEEAAGDNVNVEVAIINDDPAREAQLLSQYAARQVDYVVASPTSPEGSLASIRNLVNSGVKVVCFNTCLGDASESLVEGFVATDHYAMGEEIGKYAAKWINDNRDGKATIGIVHCNTYIECQDREAGFKKALADGGVTAAYPNEQLALAPDKAATITENMLTGNPDIDLMWGGSDGSTSGITTAVGNDPNWTKRIRVFGQDISPELAKRLSETPPILIATAGQDGPGTGKAAYDMVNKLMNGEKIDQFKVEIGPTVFARDNPEVIEEYLASTN
ncbi:substrate-binding domain-containing protein [Martelella mediterranea]|uniref:substrate-binding domain-containing protein n=1 Tax=Martelella mediterranea TaxID=293089 RepID=UPI001E3C8540|nr:substrate-binding domain-containing protein [Martelella mediterranea]